MSAEELKAKVRELLKQKEEDDATIAALRAELSGGGAPSPAAETPSVTPVKTEREMAEEMEKQKQAMIEAMLADGTISQEEYEDMIERNRREKEEQQLKARKLKAWCALLRPCCARFVITFRPTLSAYSFNSGCLLNGWMSDVRVNRNDAKAVWNDKGCKKGMLAIEKNWADIGNGEPFTMAAIAKIFRTESGEPPDKLDLKEVGEYLAGGAPRTPLLSPAVTNPLCVMHDRWPFNRHSLVTHWLRCGAADSNASASTQASRSRPYAATSSSTRSTLLTIRLSRRCARSLGARSLRVGPPMLSRFSHVHSRCLVSQVLPYARRIDADRAVDGGLCEALLRVQPRLRGSAHGRKN
eukprot:COSAG02_NODE_3468_length_6694_cov_2.962092_1_plen_354_part_00